MVEDGFWEPLMIIVIFKYLTGSLYIIGDNVERWSRYHDDDLVMIISPIFIIIVVYGA